MSVTITRKPKTKRLKIIRGKGLSVRQYDRIPRTVVMSTMPELKAVDVVQTALSFTGGAVMQTVLMNGMQLGTSNATRLGQTITVKSFRLSCYIELSTSNTSHDVFRVLLVKDRQSNGVVFGISDLFNNTTGLQPLVSPLNIANSRRFKIFLDKRFQLSNNDNEVFWINKYLKRTFQTEYNGSNGGLVADIATNSLYLVFMSQFTTGGNFSTISYHVRTRYTDN